MIMQCACTFVIIIYWVSRHRALSKYFPCVAQELTAAEGAATCDQLTILTKKVIELETLNDLTTTNACKISKWC